MPNCSHQLTKNQHMNIALSIKLVKCTFPNYKQSTVDVMVLVADTTFGRQLTKVCALNKY